MVSLLRLKGYGGQAGFSVRVSGVSKQMTEGRKQSAFFFCHLFSVRCPLYLPDT
jgi:hypothetical protein